jgi:hypothetical protein
MRATVNGHEHDVLVDHSDPVPDSSRRRRDRGRLAVDPDLSLVGSVEPVKDPHQGALSGAVLAEQGVDLAGAHIEVDVVVGELPGKRLVMPRISSIGTASPGLLAIVLPPVRIDVATAPR